MASRAAGVHRRGVHTVVAYGSQIEQVYTLVTVEFSMEQWMH
jgi:hypothetical protein